MYSKNVSKNLNNATTLGKRCTVLRSVRLKVNYNQPNMYVLQDPIIFR